MRALRLKKIYGGLISAVLFVLVTPPVFLGWLIVLLSTPFHDGSDVPEMGTIAPAGVLGLSCGLLLAWWFYKHVTGGGRN